MKKEIKLLAMGFGIAILGGFTSISIYKSFDNQKLNSQSETTNPSTFFTNNKSVLESPKSFEYAAKMSVNAVVHIKTKSTINKQVDPLYQFFYGGKSSHQQPILGSGSGVIVSEDGYIVTNNHVIENAQVINITLNNKKTYKAELIGVDPNTDLALIKIDGENFPYISYGNSNELNVGEWVLAVGNPFNLTSTVTAGIVSAKGRDINILRNDPYTGISAIESFIQTDAAVNPGNSGGALISSTGKLVGINSAIKSNTGSFTGYSFAIPVNIVKKVVKDLKEFGKVQRAFIGVSIRNINEELGEDMSLKNLDGVFIDNVIRNGSADKAGIKAGDIIKKVGNKTVNNVPELQEELSQFRPGDNVIISLIRDNDLIETSVTLKNLKGNEAIIRNGENNVLQILGAKMIPTNKDILQKLNISNGVSIGELYNGKLRSVGIKQGFIITKINSLKINSVNDVVSILNKTNDGILIEGIYPNGKKEFYGFGMK
jgi:serine protease Do